MRVFPTASALGLQLTPPMSDNKDLRNQSDRSRISLEQEHEVRYWTQALGVTREELEEAVKAAGNSSQKVREHLKK
jgi:hypothetical protein